MLTDRHPDAPDMAGMDPDGPPTTSLTYRDLAARLGISVDAAQTRVRRAGWRRVPGNDGAMRIAVPLDALPPGGEEAEPEPSPTDAVQLALAALSDAHARELTALGAMHARELARLEADLAAAREHSHAVWAEHQAERAEARTALADAHRRADDAAGARERALDARDAADRRAADAQAGRDEARALADEARALADEAQARADAASDRADRVEAEARDAVAGLSRPAPRPRGLLGRLRGVVWRG